MKKHPSIPDHAVDILLDFCKDMKAEPRKLRMENWMEDITGAEDIKEKDRPPCNTVMCIAGGIALKTCSTKNLLGMAWYEIPDLAAETLGMEYNKDTRYEIGNLWNLFIPEYWPFKYRELYEKAKSQSQRVRVMTWRVKYFIEKGY